MRLSHSSRQRRQKTWVQLVRAFSRGSRMSSRPLGWVNASQQLGEAVDGLVWDGRHEGSWRTSGEKRRVGICCSLPGFGCTL